MQRAAGTLGHEVAIVDFRRLDAWVSHPEKNHLHSLNKFDGVLVRTMPPGSLEQVVFRMDVLNVLAKGILVLNPPRALEMCIDKYLATARLEAAGLPVPATFACQDAESAMEAFSAMGGDVVVKPLFGSEGRGMMRVSDPDLAWRSFRTLERLQAVLYLQEFIPHQGWDLRILVMGNRVVAAMRRRAKEGWRTNVAQGGMAEKALVGDAEAALALRAAQAVGATLAGVDLLQSASNQWYVLEVNAVPGWRALAPVTGVDVAVKMLQFMMETVKK